MSRNLKLYLVDILNSIDNIQSDTTNISYEEFVQDRRTKDAVILNLLIIGEATKQIPQDIRDQHPEIQWKQIAGMRDMIAHAYFSINNKIVWNIIENDLDFLKTCIKNIQSNEEDR
ncbi:DUF86 domain-containing protein [Limnothrix sp. FACHB-881]|nr:MULTISPECIES: DUF86 domain-containing protein [unclassified Limnothrix]MBD2553442.1 DUF86 domain-containing protein [Limnothrix sp. FACHB-708]MBD2590482.1 DUF86 domain-containing protein [Limnothrix sp. FACHB-406]MBD2635496.1 DUF86 domain-containing protein [Limnothrix sp. FACHB-881]